MPRNREEADLFFCSVTPLQNVRNENSAKWFTTARDALAEGGRRFVGCDTPLSCVKIAQMSTRPDQQDRRPSEAEVRGGAATMSG